MHLPYRSDIDGLRAFAVSAVLIFHAFPSLIPGGFVGVDVFFVISGFLISGIIFKELETSSFSFSNFYARRVKRIFPALITMLTASYAFGWFFLFNEDFRRLGSHIFRASLFLSNFILWREAGYFDNAAETKPLLHLWSLGIEEQFYIVWPVILWVFWRFKSIRLPLIALLTLSSLIWNIYQSQLDLTHDFYSPLTRFWELSAGAWLAFHVSRQPQTHRQANLISAIALLLLLVAVFLIDSKKAFPGGWALMPVLGAVLLIYAGPTAWCNKVFFSNRVAVWVGAISYPLYLWHWPVLAFARIVEGATPSVGIRLGAVVLSVALAWVTFVCIEKPIRFGWKSTWRTPLLVLTMAAIGYVGLACKNAGGYPLRPIMQARVEANVGDIGHETFHAYYAEHFFACADARVHAKSEKWGDLVRCFQTKRDAPIDLVMIGDSHAEHLLLGMAQALPHLNIAVYPRSELPFTNSNEYTEIFESLINDRHVKHVLLTSMWAVAPLTTEEHVAFKANLNATIKHLTGAGKHVVLTTDTPKFGFDPQRCKYKHPLSGQTGCDESSESYRQILLSYSSILESMTDVYPDVSLVRLDEQFCDEFTCRMAMDGRIMFRDNNHVNVFGSQLIGAALANELLALAPKLKAK
jgi:peptidoglycan/LPS O-acetylase OafA/YrhL